MKHFVLAAVLCFSAGPFARAEAPDSRKPIALEVSSGGSFADGNANKKGTANSFRFECRDKDRVQDRWYLTLRAENSYAQTNGVKDTNNGSFTFDVGVNFWERENIFYFSRPAYNEFQKLELRLHNGAGWKHYFVKNSTVDFSMSGAFVSELEDLSGDPGHTTHFARFSVRPKLKFQFNKAVSFEAVSFYMPRLDRWEDFRILRKV